MIILSTFGKFDQDSASNGNSRFNSCKFEINMEFQPFCEISTREIHVKNLSECPFDLEVYNSKHEDAEERAYQRLATICVLPSVVTVKPFDTATLTVKVHPYVMTKFSKKYELKVSISNRESFN